MGRRASNAVASRWRWRLLGAAPRLRRFRPDRRRDAGGALGPPRRSGLDRRSCAADAAGRQGGSGAWSSTSTRTNREPAVRAGRRSRRASWPRTRSCSRRRRCSTASGRRARSRPRALCPRTPRRTVKRHALQGNLVLVGAGDPALARRGFARHNGLPVTPLGPLASRSRRPASSGSTGKVLADDTIFDRQRRDPDERRRRLGRAGPLSGLAYDSGFVHGHSPARPELVAARGAQDKLREDGREGEGTGTAGRDAGALLHATPLARSAPPAIVVADHAVNTPSNNFFAEMLLKRLAASPASTWARRAAASQGTSASPQRDRRSVRLENGSGLSRRNRASPRTWCQAAASRWTARRTPPPTATRCRLAVPAGDRRRPHVRDRGRAATAARRPAP